MSERTSQPAPPDALTLKSEMQRCWPLAQARWSRFLLMNDPDLSEDAPSVAQIQLRTRQVTLNDRLILKYDLVECVEGLLAHEVGHHVRYPGTLVVEARMRMLEKSIIPLDRYSLTNVFQDLMINQFLGHDLQDQFVRIYQAFTSEPAFHSEMAWKRDPAFLFYLSLYEVLWQLDAGTLIGSPEAEFSSAFPGYRAEAHVLVNNLFRMDPNIYTQFLYFTSVMSRYLKPMIDDQLRQWKACDCGSDQPSAEDWADALTPTDAERQAIERAVRAGWFSEDQADRLRKLNELEERIASLPGFGTDDARLIPDVMAAHYRQLAEQHLLKPPPLPRLGEAIVPTTVDDWDFSDPIRDIDWLTTLTQRGADLGTAQPLKRIPIAETEGFDLQLWQPLMEIYLDVSGSMPNPIHQLNSMTLAAQILTLGTTRAGGSVRSALYSHEPVLYWSWCRSEVEMSRFLMHYIGGGTDFPFELLRKSCSECGSDQPIRVVISDSDFDSNYEAHSDNADIFVTAAQKSAHWILLLHNPDPQRVQLYRARGATVVEVKDLADFPGLAAELSHSLFPDDAATVPGICG
ncbi:MAG: hypothetical protein R3C59_14145 [Planctomycetaceae bacterium]